MATQYDPTSTSYTTRQLGGGAFTDDQIQQLQQAGVTMGDLQNLGVLGPPEQAMTSGTYTSGGGAGTQNEQLGLTQFGKTQQQNATMLKMMLALGGGQQKQQGPPTPGNAYGQAYPLYATDAQGNPTGKPVYANPTNQASLLGAAALGIGGGQSPVVINQPPSSALDPRSGVSKVGGALIGTATPQMGWNWDTLAHAAGLDSPAIAAYAKAGYTPDTLGKKLGLGSGADPGMAGPWMNAQTGSVFTPVARTAPTQVTPLQGAVQPVATAYNPVATPFAQAPPAPGLQIPQTPFVAAHTNALADAGRALFAHFGGDPNSAGPADIANFHDQLRLATGAGSPMANPLASGPPQPIPWQQAWAGQHGLTNPTPPAGGPSPLPWQGGPNPQTGVMPNFNPTTLAAAPQPTAVKKMASGGRVPGRGNEDTVPALLTPGEYVIPRPQVQQLMRTGRLPIKMAEGGTVPDSDQNTPPEARRKPLTTPTSSSAPSAPSAPTTPTVPTGSHLASGLTTAAQTYANSVGAGARDIRNTPLDPDPDIPYLKAAGMDTGGGMSKGMQSALGGVGSGLTQAAQAIASSVKPWQMQQSAIPAPPPAPAAPQFTQQQIPQQRQGSGSPYIAYATYPASPYST